jgi:hypothetical protein
MVSTAFDRIVDANPIKEATMTMTIQTSTSPTVFDAGLPGPGGVSY